MTESGITACNSYCHHLKRTEATAGLKRSSRFKGGVMSCASENQLMNTAMIILENSNGKT